jgi:hypothetical protein
MPRGGDAERRLEDLEVQLRQLTDQLRELRALQQQGSSQDTHLKK